MKNTNPYSRIIVTGSISWDIIMNFPNKFADYLQPDKLHQINVSFVVNSLEKQMGGTGTNISFAVSQAAKQILNSKSQFLNKLNKQNPKQKQIPVYLLGGLGKDGKEQMQFFEKNNINSDGIVIDKNLYCASGTVITDTKDNQIWGFYYGACARGKDVNFEQYVKKDNVMIISANHPDAFLAAQMYAIQNKIAYMYDCGMALSWMQRKDLENGINHCSWLIGNDYEIALICKTLKITVKDIVAKGIDVITTLGEKGVRYESAIDSVASFPPVSARFAARCRDPFLPRHLSHNSIQMPAFKVKKVVDPTGAGDAWRGGFITALCAGADIETSLKVGNVMASFAIETYGTVNYVVKKSEFEKRLQCLKS